MGRQEIRTVFKTVWNCLLLAYALDDTNFYLHLTRFMTLFTPTLQYISPSCLVALKTDGILHAAAHFVICPPFLLDESFWDNYVEGTDNKTHLKKMNKDKLNKGSASKKMTLFLSSPTSTMPKYHSLCTSLRITSCRTEIKNVVVMSNQYLTFCLMTRPDVSFRVMTG